LGSASDTCQVDDLFTKGLAPTVEGIISERCEVTRSAGKEVAGAWQKIDWSDKDGRPLSKSQQREM
jgi:hypothetical protein